MKNLQLIFAFSILSTIFLIASPPTFLDHNDPAATFYAVWKKGKVIISWEGEMEGNYFEIEYSNNGDSFETITSSLDEEIMREGEILYFIDESPELEGYYRLVQINKKGEIIYSDTIHVSPLPLELTLEGLK